MKMPKWASDLLLKVLIDYKCFDKPTIEWRRRHARKGSTIINGSIIPTTRPRKAGSSGVCYNNGRIVITAGSLRRDQKLVFLHEMAHWLMPAGEYHGKAFWDLAFELYRRYKVPMHYALDREKGYRKEAEFAYKRNLQRLKDTKLNK